MIIAIDGPAGSGKSSLARELARSLGFVHLDTGALYRCVALAAMRRDVDITDASALTALAQQIDVQFKPLQASCDDSFIMSVGSDDALDGELKSHGPDPIKNSAGQKVILDGEDVTDEIRQPVIDACVSQVASIQGVRDSLLELQRSYADKSLVAEGRDVSTVVFPHAELKLYLTATPQARAQRRFLQVFGSLPESNDDPEFIKLLEAIEKRDELDKAREIAPLQAADDAVILDTSQLSFEQVLSHVRSLVTQH